MNRRSVETSVGIFVLIGLVCVGYLTVRLGQMQLIGGDYYVISAKFDSIAGLKEGARIDIAGVEVGQVESIRLDIEEMLAEVHMKIRLDIPVDEDTFASIKTSGLIGDKYIQLEPGGSDVLLKNGDKIDILNTESAVDLERLIGEYAFGEV